MRRDLQPFPPTAMTVKPRLIICERMGTWAARMRPRVPSEMLVRQTRSVDACLDELREAPASLLVVEVTPANLADLIRVASELGQSFPHARMIVVAERSHRDFEDLVREAGAVHFATSPRSADVLSRIAMRHAERVPRGRVPLSMQVWESLPWHDAATA